MRQGTSLSTEPGEAVAELRAALDQPGMQAVLLFCSPSYDLGKLGAAIREAFACPVIACTSAGQIGPTGYQRGGITGASLAGETIRAHPYLIAPLSECRERAAKVASQVRSRMESWTPERQGFGLLLVDGLALAEEGLAATLYQSIGNVPIVGGSAGDDLKFEHTAVYWDGEFLSGAAVFTLFETSLPFATFKLQHFRPTEKRLVITAADTARRVVKEINGLPAADAYSELVGIPVERFDANVFSKNPVMLRIGTDYYVRSIAQVNPDRSMTFFCAIDEGLVLRLGECVDPMATLEEGFRDATAAVGTPSIVIGCDCILRRLDLEQRHQDGRAGAILSTNKVIGFSTFGEQFNGVHVNQTFTGIALGQ